MSRAARIVKSITINYAYQVAVSITGLVITPLLLARVGLTDYGLWLVAGQILGYLALLDLGIAAILPREIGRASGEECGAAVLEVIRQSWILVRLQTPVVALIALCAWYFISESRPELSGPLAIILSAFVVQFPFRVFGAALTGLQDLSFCAIVSAVSWATTTVVSVGLVLCGAGLYALAIGWSVGVLVGACMNFRRLRSRMPARTGPQPAQINRKISSLLRASVWASVAQLAQVLTNGTDLLVLAWIIGPETAVIYSCTSKLVVLASNQCYAVTMAALPALSQVRGSGDQTKLVATLRAVGLSGLLVTGAAAIIVMAINEIFVSKWVGPAQFGGTVLNILILCAMVVRQMAFTCWSAIYVLGFERRIAIVMILDGVVTAGSMVLGAMTLGIIGIPIGSLAGVCLVYLPIGMITLAAALRLSSIQVIRWITPWLFWFVIVFVPLSIAVFYWGSASWRPLAYAMCGLTAYAIAMNFLASREPLKGYRARFLHSVGHRLLPARWW